MAVYYIGTNGDDTSGNGTQTYPWLSLGKAYDEAVAGEVVKCRGGIYSGGGTNLPYYISTVGTAAAPIVVENYPGETPIFDGTGIDIGTQNVGFFFYNGAAYHTIRGLTLRNWQLYNVPGQGSALIDTTSQTPGGVHHISVEDCVLDHQILTEPTNNDHVVYIGSGTDYFTIAGCTIIGPGKTSTFAAGFHLYHTPGSRHIVFSNNIVLNCRIGVLLWMPAAEGGTDYQFLHNTFIDCGADADLRYGDHIIVRDNASNGAADTFLRGAEGDTPYFVKDHNFYAQSFDSTYHLLPGNTGIGAASDGLDAGALNINEGVPGPGTGLTHAFVSGKVDGSDPTKLQPSHWNAEHVIGTLRILSGEGTPEGGATAPVGSVYLRTDGSTGTTFYVKEAGVGNTGWAAK